MASRRTRIKGIANIPQRRKTTNGPNPEENAKLSPEIGHDKDEEPNLNVKHEIFKKDFKAEECLTGEKELQNDVDKSREDTEKIANVDQSEERHSHKSSPILQESASDSSPKVQNDVQINAETTKLLDNSNNKNQGLCISSESVKDTSSNILNGENVNDDSVKDKTDKKPVVPVRRKFLKPTVSVNAICRKSKDVEEVKPTIVNNTANGRNNKIVILNEVISYANQNRHVVIQNHKTDEDLNVSPTEVGSGVYKSPEIGNNVCKPPEVANNVYKIPELGNIVYKTPEVGVNSHKPHEMYNGKTFTNSSERDIKRLVPHSPQLTPEIEYPIPPPSPNKINRSRIKAVPRLGQRNTSVSASESEDESRRNYRHRNDSVCSSASGLQDTNSIPECLSPQKPKEFNSVIQRKCRRTEQSRKLAEARRDFYLKFGNNKPDRQKLTMIDLIFYNPVTNPMSSETKKRKTSEGETESKEAQAEEESVDDPSKAGSDEENEIPAPQIKIGPSGEIVVDEQSLVIENKQVKKSREEIEKSEVVNGDFETGYGMYKRAKRSKDWSKKETLKFYKALNTIGTDFTLMCELFPRRSRRELKMKFKKEERVNKALVDKAIMQPCGFDFNDFKHEVDMEEKELQELEKQKEREKVMRQEAKKRKAVSSVKKEPLEKQPKLDKPKQKKKKTLDILNVLDDSDADESEVESVEDEETEDSLLQTIQKPTRSGRVPKILDRYKAPEPDKSGNKTKAEPGSLIVVASTGANGQPVYKVCMVTGEHDRQQIGDDMTSLEKALECKENGITSLFTLSATAAVAEDIPENNQTIPAEENNVTIPAEGVC